MNYKARISSFIFLAGLIAISAYACFETFDTLDQVLTGTTEKAIVEQVYDPSIGSKPTGRLKATVKLQAGGSSFDIDAIPGLKTGESIDIIRFSNSVAPASGGWISPFFLINELSLPLGLVLTTIGAILAVVAARRSKLKYAACLCLWASAYCWSAFAVMVVVTDLDLGFPSSSLAPLLPAMLFLGCAVYWDPKRIYDFVMDAKKQT